MKQTSNFYFFIFLILLIFSCQPEVNVNNLPLNEKLTYLSWKGFEMDNHYMVIKNSTKCINTFKDDAIKLHETIKKRPPIGAGLRIWGQKQKILERGVLNDVATCLVILGKSYRELGEFEKAKEVFGECLQFPYARTWDPMTAGFWSPSEHSACQIIEIEKALKFIENNENTQSSYSKRMIEMYKNSDVRYCGSFR